jgi:hypothetical protein
MADRAHLRPSGLVPGSGVGRRARRFGSTGGDEEDGPDCVFPNLCRVFFVRNLGLVVISFSFEVLVVICSVTAE